MSAAAIATNSRRETRRAPLCITNTKSLDLKGSTSRVISAQTIRAILLAMATVASRTGFRGSIAMRDRLAPTNALRKALLLLLRGPETAEGGAGAGPRPEIN